MPMRPVGKKVAESVAAMVTARRRADPLDSLSRSAAPQMRGPDFFARSVLLAWCQGSCVIRKLLHLPSHRRAGLPKPGFTPLGLLVTSARRHECDGAHGRPPPRPM